MPPDTLLQATTTWVVPDAERPTATSGSGCAATPATAPGSTAPPTVTGVAHGGASVVVQRLASTVPAPAFQYATITLPDGRTAMDGRAAAVAEPETLTGVWKVWPLSFDQVSQIEVPVGDPA